MQVNSINLSISNNQVPPEKVNPNKNQLRVTGSYQRHNAANELYKLLAKIGFPTQGVQNHSVWLSEGLLEQNLTKIKDNLKEINDLDQLNKIRDKFESFRSINMKNSPSNMSSMQMPTKNEKLQPFATPSCLDQCCGNTEEFNNKTSAKPTRTECNLIK